MPYWHMDARSSLSVRAVPLHPLRSTRSKPLVGRFVGWCASHMGLTARTGCAFVLLVAAIGAPAARAATEKCAGENVTISWQDPGVGPVINGTSGRDVIQGGPDDEEINAKGGGDFVCGGRGFDAIDGGAGRDELLGEGDHDSFGFAVDGTSPAEDLVVGGPGDDSASYLRSPVGVTVNQTTGLVQADGAAHSGGIQGIESVAGSKFDDRLIGNKVNNEIVGVAGEDFIDGRTGNDKLNGGKDIDLISYATAQAPLLLIFQPGGARVGSGESADFDVLTGFERAVGTDFDDKLKGSEDNDEFAGGLGDDVLKGFGGDDILEGGDGDDSMYPGPGDDFIDGGASDPVSSAGEHGDLVSYAEDEVDEDATQFEASLMPDMFGNPPGSSGVGEDEFASVESVRGVPQKTNILKGDGGPNVLIGGGRTDALLGSRQGTTCCSALVPATLSRAMRATTFSMAVIPTARTMSTVFTAEREPTPASMRIPTSLMNARIPSEARANSARRLPLLIASFP